MAHRVAPEAECDLSEIWFYVATESGSIEVADRVVDSISGRYLLLASFPYMGRSRDEGFGAGASSFALGPARCTWPPSNSRRSSVPDVWISIEALGRNRPERSYRTGCATR